MDWLWEPFARGFMQEAALVVTVVAIGCAWLGVHIVLRRMSLIGDALAHSTLPGVVVAYVFSWPLLLGGLGGAMSAVICVALAGRGRNDSEDSAIAVFYTGLFAAGIIGLHQVGAYRDLTHILLGNPLGITPQDRMTILIAIPATLALLAVSHRLLTVTVADSEFARSIGWSPDWARLIVLVAAAVIVVMAISVAGLILTVALIVTPVATARHLARTVVGCIVVASILGIFGGLGGLIASYHLDVPVGATMVTLLTGIYVLVRIAVALLRRRVQITG
jgi:manganese/iron transport system permease protein